jgi:hypothetical protein
MNSLTFVKGQGGLGRPLAGSDYISGLLFYTGATLPTGFTSNDRIKVVYSLQEAVALGITNTSLGETASTATYAFSNAGTAGNTLTITCATINGTVTLASYTTVSADVATTTTAATRLALEINLGTPTHGFTASPSTSTVTITAAPGQGLFLNSGTPYVVTIVGTIAGTLTQNVVTGAASDIDIIHYHVSEFFRVQPKGKLYIGLYATADVGTFASITLMQNYSLGTIRQLGVYYKSTAFASAHVTTIQGVCTTLATNKKPLSVVVAGDIQGTSDLTTLTNMRLLNAPNVSVVIGQDGAARGYKLWKATAKSISCLGTTLGAIALSKVSEAINWVGKFDMNNGVEYDTLAYSNGDSYTTITDGVKTGLDNFGYIFLLKEIGLTGSYFNDSHTAVPLTSDYAYIENERTIDKAIRDLRTFVTPALASPITINTDGTISEDTIAYFETLCQRALENMQNNGEISDYAVIIDPAQDVLSTSTLTIAVEIIPVGVARVIVVNIGYVVSLTA